MNVAVVCTTDDPTDSLEHHAAIAADASFPIKVLPTFRPDRALAVHLTQEFNGWVERLAERSGVDIGDSFDRFLEALRQRHDFFHRMGCRISDHGLGTMPDSTCSEERAASIFGRLRAGRAVADKEIAMFASAMLHEFALWDHEKGWSQQFHFGALRNNNTRMFRLLGPDAGFDSIDDMPQVRPLARFLDRLDHEGRLAKTILYNLNPADNEMFASMIGNFQDGSIPGKMQFGPAWWFIDQKDGIERQLDALSNLGLLSCFVGMATDSRSFLSFTRHEYFRRILCNRLGGEMREGLLPDDPAMIGELVRDVCHRNAQRYFGF